MALGLIEELDGDADRRGHGCGRRGGKRSWMVGAGGGLGWLEVGPVVVATAESLTGGRRDFDGC